MYTIIARDDETWAVIDPAGLTVALRPLNRREAKQVADMLNYYRTEGD